MKFIVIFAVLVLVASCVSDRALFKEFKNKFNKKYAAEEEAVRFGIFQGNLKMIREHNAAGHSFTLGINQFTDLTNAEYRQMYLRPMKIDHEVPVYTDKVVGDIDWRTQGAVTPIKDQGQCGSCWCFSTTGMIEGCVKVDGGSLVSLSESELVDCATGYGCSGGWPYQAMQWVINNGGLCSEAAYPYTPYQQTCRKTQCPNVATLSARTEVAVGNEADLANKCAQYGPISVCIDAGHSSFQSYRSGIYYEPNCSPNNLDHAVVAVGYSSQGYWIVKNSWGTSWGQAGYIWMSKDRNNNCGIATNAWYGTGCRNL
jgi:C1A family cysteine protease